MDKINIKYTNIYLDIAKLFEKTNGKENDELINSDEVEESITKKVASEKDELINLDEINSDNMNYIKNKIEDSITEKVPSEKDEVLKIQLTIKHFYRLLLAAESSYKKTETTRKTFKMFVKYFFTFVIFPLTASFSILKLITHFNPKSDITMLFGQVLGLGLGAFILFLISLVYINWRKKNHKVHNYIIFLIKEIIDDHKNKLKMLNK